MGTIKDIYDIITDIASRATSKKRKQEIESLKSHVVELERHHQKQMAQLEARLNEKHAAEISRLKKQHASQIACMHKGTLPKKSWVKNWR